MTEIAPKMTLRLTIAVLTFKRTAQLASTLAAIPVRIMELPPGYEVTLLVIDNDPDGSAREVVEEACYRNTVYVREPTPGIAAARNRALAESGASRLLVFIDDDEIPEPKWLTSLVGTWLETEASAVMGRVISVLPEGMDSWVLAGHFFARPSHKTGTRLSAAATGNLLLDLDQVRDMKLRFDESLGLGGGEDTVFSRMMIRKGGTIVWCQESVTLDPVSADRTGRAWVLRRTFSHGNALIQARLLLARGPFATLGVYVSGVLGGLARAALGSFQFIWGVLTGNLPRRVSGVRAVFRGFGVFAAGLGYGYKEYRRSG